MPTCVYVQILPDLRESRWQKNASATIEDGRHKGKEALAWSWIIDDDMGYGDSVATYTFFASQVSIDRSRFRWLPTDRNKIKFSQSTVLTGSKGMPCGSANTILQK